MAYNLAFAGVTLPRGLYVSDAPMENRVPTAKLPRTDGARVLRGYLGERRFTVQGGLLRDASGSLEGKLDTLKAAIMAGASGPVTFRTRSDRYFKAAQVDNYSESYEGTGWGRIANIRFDVVTGDPFAYEDAVQTVTVAAPTGLTCSVSGNAYCRPVLALTMGQIGINATITNATTGEAFVLNGSCNIGDVLTVDTGAELVTLNGVEAMLFFDGAFPRLATGANSIVIGVGAGTITTATATWQNRWY